MMTRLRKSLAPSIVSDAGATAVEYSIIASAIAAVIIATVALLGTEVVGLFQTALDAIQAH